MFTSPSFLFPLFSFLTSSSIPDTPFVSHTFSFASTLLLFLPFSYPSSPYHHLPLLILLSLTLLQVHPFLGLLFHSALEDTGVQDVHDRALLYYRLLCSDVTSTATAFKVSGSTCTVSHYFHHTPLPSLKPTRMDCQSQHRF
jgi:hypothetical protein